MSVIFAPRNGTEAKRFESSYTVGEWRSLVAHLFWVQGVAGSNPVSPTIFLQ